ncbi:MAG: mycothiol system anti-sigma-R factor [Nocardioidaceae bacterium]|nr:mycothiol system anti-sigma-R factor [Nocardioidaceae bacterium]
MSGGNPHDVDCQEILERVYVFIDNELEDADCQRIRAHLAECAPCLHEVDHERMVKALIARSCAERAPMQLRERVLVSIREAQVSFGSSYPVGPGWARVEGSQAEWTQQFNTRPEMPGA